MPEFNLNWNPAKFKFLGVVFSTDVHEIVSVKFENQLSEMRKVVNSWSI